MSNSNVKFVALIVLLVIATVNTYFPVITIGG